MQGVQTIGNATLVAYDDHPILSTDPWLGGDHYAYFGSWRLPYDIPENIRKSIQFFPVGTMDDVIKHAFGKKKKPKKKHQ